jgi:hypothetical protein
LKIKLSKKEKEILHKVHLLTGKPYEDVKEIIEGFLKLGVLSCLEKEPVVFPLFGELDITYKGDKIVPQGKEAILETVFEPSPLLKRSIGQMKDGDESDLEKMLLGSIKESIQKYLE